MAGTFATEMDGRYLIRLGRQGAGWVGRAFRGRHPVTERLPAADRAGALQAVREAVQALRAARAAARAPDGSPSVDEYREAFAQIGPLHPSHLAMLKAHLAAPDHLITATQLAAAAGYPNWSAANLQYGQLAQRLAEELDYTPRTRDDGSPIWTETLATWGADGDLPDDRLIEAMANSAAHPHFQWHMRAQVRAVVRDL